jgi:hypothetical protein
VPDESGVVVKIARDRVPRIVIAVTAWEDYNADLHASVMYFR